MDEAVEWAKRCPNPHNEPFELEIRRVFEAEDFGAEFTPELREQEDHQRAESAKRNAPKPHGMGCSNKIFVNLPVKDLNRSVEFFKKLGFTFNPHFTDKNATCMIVGDNIFVMLLVEPFFQTFTPKSIADAKTSTEALIALSAVSREAVNEIVETAIAAGARRYKDPVDHGFMYGWGFEDLDGHIWEYLWMDPANSQK